MTQPPRKLNLADLKALAKHIDDQRARQKRLKEYKNAGLKLLTSELKRKVFSNMLRQLKKEPPPAKRPIQWTSERQRRYVMMLLTRLAEENGDDDIGYKRTHKLRDGWRYSIETKGYRMTITVENTAEAYDPIKGEYRKYAPFVIGNYGVGISPRSVKRYEKPIQQFHLNTGWKPAHVVINKSIDKARQIIAERMSEL